MYERLILSRITPTVEAQLSPDQAGFRSGRSCCGQVLNLVQYIEDGFQEGKITGAVFVDLTAAYDTINHRLLLTKVAKVIRNSSIVSIIQSLLTNRRFYVEMGGKQSRWRVQKNGLAQASVLAPTLFNIYTNDQPEFNNIRRFIYADDLCIATQASNFETIEERLANALEELSRYYKKSCLNANPGKTQTIAFHLKNHLAKRMLNITWENKPLKKTPYPVYLGVTLDRSLCFSEHVSKLRKKLSSRNSLVSNLANSQWGADANTLRTTSLAVCYSTAEYCSAVWERSAHAKKVDVELNKCCRTITGTLKATPLDALYALSEISPPGIRRDTIAKQERQKQLTDVRHPLYGHTPVAQRLPSRRSFANVAQLGAMTPAAYRKRKWLESYDLANDAVPDPTDSLPPGTHLPRRQWVALNRARSKVAKTGDNMLRWGLAQTSTCECGEPTQTLDHLLRHCPAGPRCTEHDLRDANATAIRWLERWSDKL